MTSPSRKAMLSLNKREADIHDTFIDCVLHAAPGDNPEFPRSQVPYLVLETSRPTVLGWRWDHSPDHDPYEPDAQHGSHERSSLEFTYRMDVNSEADAFFPECQTTYLVEAELDAQSRTLWFPLPAGRAIHELSSELDFDEQRLLGFVEDWLRPKYPELPAFWVADIGSQLYADGFKICFEADYADNFTFVNIPEEILQDPISNGSEDFDHGFNPWNEEQKSKIVAILDSALPDLIRFFSEGLYKERVASQILPPEHNLAIFDPENGRDE